MSYNCTISFKILKPSKIYDFLSDVKTVITSSIYSEEVSNFIPIHLTDSIKDCSTEKEKDRCITFLEYWLRASVFSYRTTYIPELKLFCMYSIPKNAQYIFDGTVYFQNSTDQDYARNEYGKIKPFLKIYDKWNNCSIEEFISLYDNKFGENQFDAYLEDTDTTYQQLKDNEALLSYIKRSTAYDEIWSYVESSLYEDEKITYTSLFGYYDICVHNLAKMLFDKIKLNKI